MCKEEKKDILWIYKPLIRMRLQLFFIVLSSQKNFYNPARKKYFP